MEMVRMGSGRDGGRWGEWENDSCYHVSTVFRESLTLSLVDSLHRALFGADATVNDNTATDVTHSKLSTKHHVSDQDKPEKPEKEDNQLLEQLRQANQEKLQLQTRCEELEALCKQEKDEKNKWVFFFFFFFSSIIWKLQYPWWRWQYIVGLRECGLARFSIWVAGRGGRMAADVLLSWLPVPQGFCSVWPVWSLEYITRKWISYLNR